VGKSLVTGGAGLIGSHLVKALLDEGREVVIVDDLSRGRRENLLRLGVRVAPIRLDLRDYRQVLQHMDGIEAVFHLAARVGSVESLHSTNMGELLSLQTNLVIDANVFRAALHAGVRKLVYASSVSVYPMELQRSHGAVLKEDDLRFASPEGGYGWAKLMGETQLQLVTGMAVGIARLFNIYGECAEPEEDALVVPALVRKAVLFPQEEFRVWGDGSQTRDLLHAADAVEARTRAEKPDTDDDVRALVRNVIEIVQKHGQLDDTLLTLRDLSLITESFVTTLRGQYHPRIQYPKSATDQNQTGPTNK